MGYVGRFKCSSVLFEHIPCKGDAMGYVECFECFFVLGRCTMHKGDALGYDGCFGEGKVEASSPRPIVVVKVE